MSPRSNCNDPRHDEIESWYRQALAVSQDRPGLLPDTTAEGLLRLLARAYMRGHSHGRNNNAPPNPKAAVEALLSEVVEYHTEAFGPSPDTRHLSEVAAPRQWQVHNHGPDQGRGTACREYHLNGRLVGSCKIIEATSEGAAPRAEGLDARTMKRAIINVICGWQDEEHCGRDADEIAAEYVRLSRPSDEVKP